MQVWCKRAVTDGKEAEYGRREDAHVHLCKCASGRMHSRKEANDTKRKQKISDYSEKERDTRKYEKRFRWWGTKYIRLFSSCDRWCDKYHQVHHQQPALGRLVQKTWPVKTVREKELTHFTIGRMQVCVPRAWTKFIRLRCAAYDRLFLTVGTESEKQSLSLYRSLSLSPRLHKQLPRATL